MVDVLPAPLGPSNPRMRPGCAVNDTWFTAVTLPYRFTTSRTSSILSDRAEERDLRGNLGARYGPTADKIFKIARTIHLRHANRAKFQSLYGVRGKWMHPREWG